MSKVITKQRRSMMQSVCDKLGVGYKEFAPGQFRIDDGEKTIDYYPKSNKCFWHSDHVYGEVTNVAKFLNFEFKD